MNTLQINLKHYKQFSVGMFHEKWANNDDVWVKKVFFGHGWSGDAPGRPILSVLDTKN